jgi:hypothetical protein
MAMLISSASGRYVYSKINLLGFQDFFSCLPRPKENLLKPKILAAPTIASVGILQSTLKIAQLLNFQCATKLTKQAGAG